jgi:hypothetical protein
LQIFFAGDFFVVIPRTDTKYMAYSLAMPNLSMWDMSQFNHLLRM